MGDFDGFTKVELKRLKRLIRAGRRPLAERDTRTKEEELTLHFANDAIDGIMRAEDRISSAYAGAW